MSDEIILEGAPFGRLTWDGDDWTGRVVLPGWAEFQTRLGPYAHLRSDKPSDGTADLYVFTDGEQPPSPAQARAFVHLTQNEPAVTRAVQEAILAEYPRLRTVYGRLQPVAGSPEIMPHVRSIGDLRPVIGLATVHILEEERDGIAYVGFEFGCSWDVEHGLGVMTHAGRVVEIGQADLSFQPPDADDEEIDGGARASTPPRPPRWWEFWK